MRKVVFGSANSLDNYIARRDHSTDWLRRSKEAATVSATYWKTFDTVLMGRKTFEVALRHSSGRAPYPDKQTYVFSRTCTDDAGGAVAIISSDAVESFGN
jgi:dihydrofolate reductase